ncbi:MAG: hypothetical protein FWC91_08155 [Defluviitaleaceae bacterium]|nr:hypothetical protein [Defluviitaleaceae bacterium]
MLSEKRADIITSVLTENLDRAKELSTLEPEKAVEEINKLRPGYNFTLDELVEYSRAAQELSPEELDQVAGGGVKIVVVGGVVVVGAGAVAVAVVGA